MGSPLGVAFANFYMCNLENEILPKFENQISTYCRYVDDCFIVLDNLESLQQFKNEMEQNSVLKFTYEESINNEINFLDVHVNGRNNSYITSVHTKKTNVGAYLNARSECPDRYKTGTIKALIHRSYKISSNWQHFQESLRKIKQTLINNGYSNSLFDEILRKYLSKLNNDDNRIDNIDKTHKLFYKNQYTPAYKTDERILKKIVSENVKCTKPNEKLNLIIYYKNQKTRNLIMKNSPYDPQKSDLQRTNVIYEYKCKLGGCELQPKSKYIGVTCTTLSRRLTMHLSNGAILKHTKNDHDTQLTREMLTECTKIKYSDPSINRLEIIEAIFIMKEQPAINRQDTGRQRTLHLLG